MKSYVSKIQVLERELLHLKTPESMSSSNFVDCTDYDEDGHGDEFSSDCNAKAVDLPGIHWEIWFIEVLRYSDILSSKNDTQRTMLRITG